MVPRSDFSDAVTVVDRTKSEPTDSTPVGHGLRRFFDVIDERGRSELVDHWTVTEADPFVLVGLTDDPLLDRILDADVSDPESVIYEWQRVGENERETLLVAGTDERGLMYALLELADRIEVDGIDVLATVENTVETPDNAVRGVDRFLEDPVEDSWFYDDSFWRYYLSRLARYRFNRLVLTTGYISDFMSPPYPFLVDVPGYPEVELTNEGDVGRDETLAQLRRVGQLCDAYGLEFVFASWQQQPRENSQLIANLPEEEEFIEYCGDGMYRLLTECPEIEGVQLRVNWEAGVSSGEQLDYDLDRAEGTAESFWRGIVDAVDAADEDRDRDVHLDLRAKGLTDSLIEYAVETGLDVTVPTKFWCESTGLPYHNSRMRSEELAHLDDPNKGRRYGYADFLRDSRAYSVLYRLWSIGTNRVFVWGDPDYGRRFGESAQFGDATGFEVTPPLSIKGGAADGEAWPLFADERLRDYEYEDERYWAWYLTFGRFGYSSGTDSAVWHREFERRFGEAAAAVSDGYRAASKILPLVTAAHLTRHPATSNWAELDTGGALFGEHNSNPRIGDVTYATAEPSDPGLFYGIEEYVADRETDDEDRRYTPPQVREWYLRLADEVRTAVDRIGDEQSGELRATLLDFRMLADLAEFHASQITAAMRLTTYRRGDDTEALCDAYRHAQWSVGIWERISERGDDTYHRDLSFVMDDRGQWREYLGDLEADLERLEQLLGTAGIDTDGVGDPLPPEAASDRPGSPSFPLPTASLTVPEQCPAGRDVAVTVRTGEYDGPSDFRLRYRRANHYEGDFETVEMVGDGNQHRGSIPGDYVTGEFDLLVFVTAVNDAGDPVIVPGLGHAEDPFPYRVIETVDE